MPLETWWILVGTLAVAWFVPLSGNKFFTAIELTLERLSRRRGLCIIAVFSLTILVRALLLPVLPVPAPWIHDEFSYLLQGDIFAHGRLAYPPHPMSPYFETFYVTFHPSYSSIYPPAQAAILAVGYLLGHPWIGVLLSNAAMVGCVLWMLQGWFPSSWALLGALLVWIRVAVFSYWMNSYWGGAVAAAGAALVLGAVPRLQHNPRVRDALLLGLGVGILANSRPFEGFLFCVPVVALFLFWLYRLRRTGRKVSIRVIVLPLAAIFVVVVAFGLYDNWRVTGSIFGIARANYYKEYLTVSPFVWGRISAPHPYANLQFDQFFNVWFHRQYDRTWSSLKDVEAAHFHKFWDFYMGALLTFPLITLPWVLRDSRMRFFLLQFTFCALGLAAVTWFYPHYAAPLLCTLIVLVLQAMRHLRRWTFRGRAVGIGWTRVVAILVLLQLPACAIKAARHPRVPCCNDVAHNWDRESVVRELQNMPGRHLVLVRYGRFHNIHEEWVYNSAGIDESKIIWAREIPGMGLKPLLEYYSDRKVWIIEPEPSPPRLYPLNEDSPKIVGQP